MEIKHTITDVYNGTYTGKDSGEETKSDSYGGSKTSSWDNKVVRVELRNANHSITGKGVYDPNATYDPYGGGNGNAPSGASTPDFGYAGVVRSGAEDILFTEGSSGSDSKFKMNEFTGHHVGTSSVTNTATWNDTGDYVGKHSSTQGEKVARNSFSEDGSYALVNQAAGYVSYSGTRGTNGNDIAFADTLQVDITQFNASLEIETFDSIKNQIIATVLDFWELFGDLSQDVLEELQLFIYDPIGNYQYYQFVIQDYQDSLASSAAGFIDGFLDTINPLDFLWSVPNIGPIEGHETAYTIGYVGGVGAGIGAQIAIGVLSGGATAGACANSIVRLSVSAAKIYNRIDTIAGFVSGGKILLNTYQNSGNMSGLQILGNLGSAAAGMSTGLGHLGGAALKKLDGGFLNFGGCFVAGTPVHMVASPASVLARQIAWSGANGAESYQYLISSFDSIDVAESFIVPIEEVPLGSRIATKNPEPWTVQRSVASADEANLRVIVAEVIRDDGTHVGIELLRSVDYVRELGLVAGGQLYMELEELNVAGWVQVHSIDPCPPLCEGPGNLVTGRFVTVQAANIVRATFSDGTIITGTDIHPVWSLDKEAWVPLGELSFGEQVYSKNGPLSLIDREVINRPQDVYNIEVDGQHVYQVGDSGVLVHNTCAADHHMIPRALGSKTPYRHSSLTALNETEHTALHSALNTHLKTFKKTLPNGNVVDMLPRAFNSGKVVQNNFSTTERLAALRSFYTSHAGGKFLPNYLSELRIALMKNWI